MVERLHYSTGIGQPEHPLPRTQAEDLAEPSPSLAMDTQAKDFLTSFAAGGISGSLVKTITAPVERYSILQSSARWSPSLFSFRVKIILQTQHINEQLAGSARKYRGPIDCLLRLYREEGFRSYFKGNLANILRYFPNQAFNFGMLHGC